MADISSGERLPTRGRGTEFNFYFALILMAAVPFGLASWVRDIARMRTLNIKGPLARAWCEADRITPLLFSAP